MYALEDFIQDRKDIKEDSIFEVEVIMQDSPTFNLQNTIRSRNTSKSR